MNKDEIQVEQARAARRAAEFIDMFDAPGVIPAAEDLVTAALAYVQALADAGLPSADAIRAAVGVVLKATLP